MATPAAPAAPVASGAAPQAPKRMLSDMEASKKHMRNVMVHLMDDADGGEGSEKLRIVRNKDPGPLSRVNAYWGYTIFAIKGRPFPGLPLLVYLIYSAGVVAIGLYGFSDATLDQFKTMKPELKDVTQVLGLAVFLVLAFRNNSAYQRWYDGSIRYYELCGAVGNAARQVAAVTPPEKGVDLLWWLFSGLYCAKQQLRSSRREADYSLLEEAMPPAQWIEIADRLDKFQWAIFSFGKTACRIDLPGKTEGKACEEVMKSVNPIMVAYNNCWRILRTPMPFAYLAHLRAFLCLWLALLPWVFMASYGWYSMILCGFICWGILGVEEAAVEVEQPFGRDSNDLPLDCIARDTFHLIFEFIISSGFDDQGRALSTSLSIAPAKGNEMV